MLGSQHTWGFLLAALLLHSAVPAAAAQPNILLIVSDDQGYPDLGCLGAKPLITPHLDRLAAEGVRATNFYVTWPACTPSRGSILTGRYPQRNGLYDMVRNDLVNYGHRYTVEEYAFSPEMTWGLDPREVTIGDVLRRAGYRTGVVGKWDMGQARRYLPLQRGFDFFYGHGNNGIDYYTHERYGIPSMFRGNERTVADRGSYATDLFRREAIRFIRESAGGPWFLYLAFNAPHAASSFAPEASPPREGAKAKRPPGPGVQVPERFAAIYRDTLQDEKLARYCGAVTCLDEAIGEILQLVEELGQGKNTFVVFLADNGGSGNGGNAPLRGGKGTLYEGGLRVPFLAWWPGQLPAGQVTDEFLSALEILPTLAGAAGVPAAAVAGLSSTDGSIHVHPSDAADGSARAANRGAGALPTWDGFDMLPVLRGEAKSPRREMFWQRRGEWAVRRDHWKRVGDPQGARLYDLSQDLSESRDLSAERPAAAADLDARFEQWRREMDASEPRGPFRDH